MEKEKAALLRMRFQLILLPLLNAKFSLNLSFHKFGISLPPAKYKETDSIQSNIENANREDTD